MNNQNRTSAGKRFRTADIRQSAVDQSARTVRLSISSDVPYLREDFLGQYYEILGHALGEVMADRLEAGCAMLYNHDRDVHLGRGVSFNNDGHRIEVVARFSRSAIGEEKFQDAIDGVLNQASVGYNVIDVQEIEAIDGIPAFRVVKWEPLEFSLVTIAADITVGVGREHQHLVNPNTMNPTTEEPRTNPNNGRTATQERERLLEIQAIAKRCKVSDEDVQRAIEDGISSNAFRKFVFENYWSNPQMVETPAGNGDMRAHGEHQTRSVASQIIAHREFKRIREGGRKLISFELPGIRSFREFSTRAMLTSDFGATTQQLPGVSGVSFEMLTVADLIAPGTTKAGKISYPRENSFDSGATPVAEGATKPEQSFDVEPAEAAAKKIAAWTKISDELLEDSEGAEAYINTRLGFAVQKSEDDQLLNGTGDGANMLGFLNVEGLQSQALGADTAPDAIRKAIGKIEINTDFVATGIVLNPLDWQNIELLKDENNRYLVGQITIPDEFGRPKLSPALWGRPIAVSKSITAGHALIGAFATASQLFRRTGLLIEATNTNEDDFIKNLVTIRAELRAALAIYAGAAFCEVTGLS